mmetsp:Transcript_17343/g.48098  ORF Transcript_17343/g.48098 Transcript_17343/m.48098 type:complete len:285 (+) Transcript_17343:2619-3473(+)
MAGWRAVAVLRPPPVVLPRERAVDERTVEVPEAAVDGRAGAAAGAAAGTGPPVAFAMLSNTTFLCAASRLAAALLRSAGECAWSRPATSSAVAPRTSPNLSTAPMATACRHWGTKDRGTLPSAALFASQPMPSALPSPVHLGLCKTSSSSDTGVSMPATLAHDSMSSTTAPRTDALLSDRFLSAGPSSGRADRSMALPMARASLPVSAKACAMRFLLLSPMRPFSAPTKSPSCGWMRPPAPTSNASTSSNPCLRSFQLALPRLDSSVGVMEALMSARGSRSSAS